ncbi:MAG: hypothetical protein ISR82_06650 [Candidatus Marinimicrobia bacterium]|nr:hypothetical protein [Candidatus Neomarinimicrobiota bacterium]MBL7010884.1 hypothetical protein [Candidatus Neomarinimicrobiota bacterium]MBL7030258.1 hypothetical protein [Candidatus Neomarinimicrobiota bacterium]
MKLTNILILWSTCIALQAGEVDPYLVWNTPLKDASYELNRYYNREIQKVLKYLPKDCSCETAAGNILKHFGVTLNAPLEKWIKSSAKIHKFPDNQTDIDRLFRNSIFWKSGKPAFEKGRMISLRIMIDESINVNGIIIGVDKLTHFTGSGYLYHQLYLRSVNKGNSKSQAMEKAIDLGIMGEKNILGRMASGVFSYADLEANFQGLLLGIGLCQNGKTRLIKRENNWILDKPFDIRDYVNPNWNEAFNPSFYYEEKNLSFFPKSITVLSNLSKFCPSYHSQKIQKKFELYNSEENPSFSSKYLDQLIREKEIPDPSLFDIRKICSKNKSN